ncbi:uncharacterized protein BYT42DRAFT_553506 [Radiomyces spectabilis]|uniref:uncharacterized protein n=1 Tax=Radiomyces spectabilis TaxID=64574 RepID=UPI00222009DD|nr:uncharacterized protein BYT42DRAFT_553506 [Radiomyces spectabilis]KAI8394134.1 hypothetical protein BYT42DRAFT_553506 [Radiomyces spectabilis]
MGYATLDAALAFPKNVPPMRQHIVITDTVKSDANFLIHHFVGNQLKGDRHVVLVGMAQIFNHYFLISRKLGINLQSYKQSGRFCFIDGLTHLTSYTDGTPYPPARAPTSPADTLNGSKIPQNACLRTFYDVIKRHVTDKQHPLLIIDDASIFMLSGFGIGPVSMFINKLRVLMESVDGTLMTIIHADEEGTEDPEQDAFVKSVLSTAHLVLQVQALGSGLARDVHGQLSIIHGPKCLPQAANQIIPQSLHYRILDNNAHFFAKGISQGVL